MNTIFYSLNNQIITLHLNHRAKKNIIMRAQSHDSLTISLPAWISTKQLIHQLNQQPETLHELLNNAPQNINSRLPEKLWFNGTSYPVYQTENKHATFNQNQFSLPENWTIKQQQTWLLNFFFQAASQTLLPKLQSHAEQLGLEPAKISLSKAKTFWGICRLRTGIKLNWRLIGAPKIVQDYVCIHELCHLIHPNHSLAFWSEVNQHTPHTQFSKQWLKQHGKELFILG